MLRRGRRFGAATLGLNLVPIVGPIFTLTSTVGAALWACELEKKEKEREVSGRRVGE